MFGDTIWIYLARRRQTQDLGRSGVVVLVLKVVEVGDHDIISCQIYLDRELAWVV